jgi:hypothetical protein
VRSFGRDNKFVAAIFRGRDGRSPAWIEVAVLVWLLWIYDAVNNLSPIRTRTALAHARSIWSLEVRLHLDPELSLNRWLNHHPLLGNLLSNYYDNAHFVVTLGVIGLLWWSFPAIYRRLRNMLVIINLIGFATFWLYPLAPPRMLSAVGFVDTVAKTGAFGSWHSGARASVANELAAMPSLHIAWALWCLTAIWLMTTRRSVRILGIAHVAVTTFAVLSTGNHFVIDALAGAVTAGVGFAVSLAWSAHRSARKAGDGTPRSDRHAGKPLASGGARHRLPWSRIAAPIDGATVERVGVLGRGRPTERGDRPGPRRPAARS